MQEREEKKEQLAVKASVSRYFSAFRRYPILDACMERHSAAFHGLATRLPFAAIVGESNTGKAQLAQSLSGADCAFYCNVQSAEESGAMWVAQTIRGSSAPCRPWPQGHFFVTLPHSHTHMHMPCVPHLRLPRQRIAQAPAAGLSANRNACTHAERGKQSPHALPPTLASPRARHAHTCTNTARPPTLVLQRYMQRNYLRGVPCPRAGACSPARRHLGPSMRIRLPRWICPM